MNDFVALVGQSPSDNYYWETARVDDDWQLKKQRIKPSSFQKDRFLIAPQSDNGVLTEESDVLVRLLGLVVCLVRHLVELFGCLIRSFRRLMPTGHANLQC